MQWISADPVTGSSVRISKNGAFYDLERTELEPLGQEVLLLRRGFHMKITGFSFLFIFGMLFASTNYGQTHAIDVLEIDTTCEVNIVAIEEVMRKSAEENGQIFIISHRSKFERKGVDWARLTYTRMVITQFRQFPSDKVTIAVGEPTEEKYGKLEFWVAGKLQLVAYIKKNQQICFHV